MLFNISLEPSAVHIPVEFEVSVAYPNPFNPITTIDFGIPVDYMVTISIYDINGKMIETLMNEHIDAGYHSVTWNAQNQSSGLYFLKITSGQFQDTQKIMLIK